MSNYNEPVGIPMPSVGGINLQALVEKNMAKGDAGGNVFRKESIVMEIEFDDDEENENMENEKQHKAVFSYKNFLCFTIAAHAINKHLESICSDKITVANKATVSMDCGFEETCPLLILGQITFTVEGKLIVMNVDVESNTITIFGNHDTEPLRAQLLDRIKNNNCLRRKHIQLIPARNGCEVLFKKTPTISFDNLIAPQNIKDDIYDNTIFQLKHINSNNGIILYGSPGCGKSLTCQAAISEAIKEGFSTCFIADQVDFALLDDFLQLFIAPCLIVMEDIDSFCQSRTDTLNPTIAGFLQFMNGLSERKEKLVCIATTNHLEHLDKAVANRPVRFNRKIKFDYPSAEEVYALLDLYFPDTELTDAQRDMCCGFDFCGAHIHEIRRTAELLSKKENVELVNVFDRAVEVVKLNFTTTLSEKTVGFG